jgi:hypothetical protein
MRFISRQTDRFRLPILGLIVAAVVACTLDLPTPVVVPKDTTVAFPCQDRPCGCQDAEECWSKCCCFSDAEKLAWARVNKVQPPAWFLAKCSAESSTTKLAVSKSGSNSAPKTCCCCQKANAPKTNEVLSKSERESTLALVQPAAPVSTRDVRLTVRQQRGCSGQHDLLKKQIVWDVTTPEPENPEHVSANLDGRDPDAEPIVLDLPTPPPRVCATDQV